MHVNISSEDKMTLITVSDKNKRVTVFLVIKKGCFLKMINRPY